MNIDGHSQVPLDQECFVIAPIGDEGSEERRRSDGILNYIVRPAAQELGLTAVRADEIARPGSITLQVTEHVLDAQAVVADLTDHNPNVFYELGIRHTARKPTVLIAEEGERLPFDVGQERTIFFNHTDLASADGCRRKIVNLLTHARRGVIDSPVTAAVDLRRLESGNPLEKQIASLIGSFDRMASTQGFVLESLERILDPSSGMYYPLWRGFDFDSESLEPLAATLESNLNRLRDQLDTAVGVDNEMIQAIFRDTFSVVAGLRVRIKDAIDRRNALEKLDEAKKGLKKEKGKAWPVTKSSDEPDPPR